MTQQLPAPRPGGQELSRLPHRWDGTAWVAAPAGWVPPAAWWPVARGWQPAPAGWQVPADWVWTPSGRFPPPAGAAASPFADVLDGAPDAATRGFGWSRVLPGRLQRAASAADRTPSGWEIVIMLGVFPAAAVVAALISLAQTLANYSDGSAHAPTIVPHHTAVSTVLFVVAVLTDFAPAALAVYFLTLSGGGLRAIGLDLSRPRRDLSRCAKLVLYAYVGPILVVGGLLGQFTPNHALAGADSSRLPLAYLVPFVLSALSAGVVEEIVVLGFLCHRLEQRGWNGWRLYAVLIAVRVSYHLYYGTAAIGFAVWGGVSVLLYRRRRRLLTFIVAHLIWDTAAFVTEYLHGAAALLPFAVEIVLLAGLWLSGRAPAVAEMTESGRARARGETALPTPV